MFGLQNWAELRYISSKLLASPLLNFRLNAARAVSMGKYIYIISQRGEGIVYCQHPCPICQNKHIAGQCVTHRGEQICGAQTTWGGNTESSEVLLLTVRKGLGWSEDWLSTQADIVSFHSNIYCRKWKCEQARTDLVLFQGTSLQ